jgi:alpha-glucuronidase
MGRLKAQSFRVWLALQTLEMIVNWCGHPIAQANWYAFGALAWDSDLTSESIADEWIKMTYSNQQEVVQVISKIMLDSREAAVNYMTPLGLHHIMGWDHHYGLLHGSKINRALTGPLYIITAPIPWPSDLNELQKGAMPWVNTLPRYNVSMNA